MGSILAMIVSFYAVQDVFFGCHKHHWRL